MSCRSSTGIHDHHWFLGEPCRVCGAVPGKESDSLTVECEVTTVVRGRAVVTSTLEEFEGTGEPAMFMTTADPCPFCGEHPLRITVVYEGEMPSVDVHHEGETCVGAASLAQDIVAATEFADYLTSMFAPLGDADEDEIPEVPDGTNG